ncbi:hypothetical protein J7L48_02190 [bacterium]|nr:hypothetical protein [bacterium]
MKIKNNIDLRPYSSMGIKSTGKIMYSPETLNEVKDLLRDLKNPFILGGGSNTVFSEYIKRPIINTALLDNINIKGNSINMQCGVSNAKLLEIALRYRYGDLLSIYGIPGTIGGAVKGNVSLFRDMSLFNVIKNVLTIDKNGNSKNLTKFKAKYRDSNIDDFIFEINMELEPNKKGFDELFKKVKAIRERQPKGKSSGSMFKNPEGTYAGYLIDQCGLKGSIVGGMKISEGHGNFFINFSNGSYTDLMELIKSAKRCVHERFNIELELEVKIVAE